MNIIVLILLFMKTMRYVVILRMYYLKSLVQLVAKKLIEIIPNALFANMKYRHFRATLCIKNKNSH